MSSAFLDAAVRVGIKFDLLTASLVEALRACRDSHRAMDPPGDRDRDPAGLLPTPGAINLPPWFWSGTGQTGADISDPGDSDGSTSLGGSGGGNDDGG